MKLNLFNKYYKSIKYMQVINYTNEYRLEIIIPLH